MTKKSASYGSASPSLGLRALSLLALLASALPIGVGSTASAQTAVPLFAAPADPAEPGSSLLPPSLRSRAVSIAFDALAADPSHLRLTLFPDVDVMATTTSADSLSSGSRIWRGEVDAPGGGEVTLVFRGDTLSGSVRVGAEQFGIQRLPNGDHAVFQEDPAGLDVGDDVEVSASQPELLARAGGLPDDGSVIDLVVGYTPQFATQWEANNQITAETRIELLVDDANQALASSLIPTQLRLVRVAEVPDGETGGIYGRLVNPADGHMDEIHPLRDAYRADLAAMCVWSSGESADGRGTFGGAFSFSKCGFQRVFRHEMGHNLGCHHDRLNVEPFEPEGGFPDRYHYGYRFLGDTGSWADIMTSHAGNIALYSTPDVIWDGVPAGSPFVDAESTPESADCARAIRERLPDTANFRRSELLVPDTLIVLNDQGSGIDVFGVPPHSTETDVLFHTAYQALQSPVAIAHGGGETAYAIELAGSYTYEIVALDLAQGTAAVITPTPLPFLGTAITVGPNGHLYATSFRPDCSTYPGLVLEIDPQTGGVVTSWQGGELCQPVGIAIAPNGDLLVADACNGAACAQHGKIVRIRQGDGFQSVLASGGHLQYLASLAELRDDDLVVLSRDASGDPSLVRVDVETGQQTLLATGFAQDYYGSMAALPDGDVAIAAGGSLLRYDSESMAITPIAAATTAGSIAVDVVRPDLPACYDQSDNDGDGLRDYPEDPGCASFADATETAERCGNGIDDDGDGLADFPADPGCTSGTDDDERGTRACDNGLDDDGDGKIDFPADGGCTSAYDSTEGGGGGCGLGVEVGLAIGVLGRLGRRQRGHWIRARPAKPSS